MDTHVLIWSPEGITKPSKSNVVSTAEKFRFLLIKQDFLHVMSQKKMLMKSAKNHNHKSSIQICQIFVPGNHMKTMLRHILRMSHIFTLVVVTFLY